MPFPGHYSTDRVIARVTWNARARTSVANFGGIEVELGTMAKVVAVSKNLSIPSILALLQAPKRYVLSTLPPGW